MGLDVVTRQTNAVSTNSTTIYVAGYAFGGLFKFQGAAPTRNCKITEWTVIANGTLTTSPVFNLYFFNAPPTNSTYVDHAQGTISYLDAPNLIFSALAVTVGTATGAGTGSVYTYSALGAGSPALSQDCFCPDGNIYMVALINSTTTFTAVHDVTFQVKTETW